MLKFSFFIVILLFSCTSNNIEGYVKANTQVIKTIEPDSLDFTDLQAIGNAIGDAKVVMLGEQDHGDAPTFLAKTRLIKYLHEQKGFNVLAFESDFFALNKGWDELPKQSASIVDFLHNNIFKLWTNCVECEELFYSYIPSTFNTATPLQVSGFDNQNNGEYSIRHLRSYIDSYVHKKNIPFLSSGFYPDFFLPSLDSTYLSARSNSNIYYGRLGKVTDSILTQLNILDSNAFHNRVLLNLRGFMASAEMRNNMRKSMEIRDELMANNLNWLVKTKYPNEKIIVWAANFHILKNVSSLKNEKDGFVNMGDRFTKMARNEKDTYILGFTSNRGKAGRLYAKQYPVEPPKEDGFETWINKDLKYGFVDFKKYRKGNMASDYFYLKGYHHSMLADWTKMYDGVFYIRDMYPCRERN